MPLSTRILRPLHCFSCPLDGTGHENLRTAGAEWEGPSGWNILDQLCGRFLLMLGLFVLLWLWKL